jgi:C4-dicarboxylate-specific signal transduction histidine kinase
MRNDLQRAMEQVHKASQIISHLRTFGRAAPASRENISINTVVVQTLSLLHEQLRLREINVVLELHEPSPVVVGNAIQLEQVFLNLLTNARDALAHADRKTICIRSYLTGQGVRLVFQDSGPGIPVELQRRVFDPFFTTKEVGAGTGLGLSIAYGIVRDHEGSITIEGVPECGATFVIDLPLARQPEPTEGTQ